jgi:hypothetical protein
MFFMHEGLVRGCIAAISGEIRVNSAIFHRLNMSNFPLRHASLD